MKKILFVGLAYYPYVGYGGPVRVMRCCGLALTAMGHDVTIYCSNIIDRRFRKMAGHTVQAEREGMRVVYLNSDLRLSDGLTLSLDLLRYLKREMFSYDLVHLFGSRDYFTGMAALYARKYGIPYLIHPMGSMNYKNSKVVLKTLWDAALGRRLIHGAKLVVEATEEQVMDLLDYGIPRSKTAVLPWSPDPDLVRQETRRGSFREKFRIPPGESLILFLSRIHRKKRLDLLIRALPLLEEKHSWLAVVGHDDDGSMEGLKALAETLGVASRVVWAGPIHSPESAFAYRDADVYCLVSEHESAPMALLEACSMGVPVLISDHMGMSEMVQGQAGMVVDMTPEAVAAGINALTRDEGLRRKYAAGGRRLIAENFSIDALGSRIMGLYDRVGEPG
jgi:glycosyltransferase involved in cell wall biosynthesis